MLRVEARFRWAEQVSGQRLGMAKRLSEGWRSCCASDDGVGLVSEVHRLGWDELLGRGRQRRCGGSQGAVYGSLSPVLASRNFPSLDSC